MPAFIGGSFEGASGWTPGVDAVKSAIEYTTARLGSRLLGFNWWSLDRHLVELGDLYQYVKSTPGGGSHDGGGGPSTDPDNDLAQQLFERALTAQREALEATEALQGVLPGV
jgi:hypothetical protein